MTVKQINPYAEMVVACSGDRRYGREAAFEDNVLAKFPARKFKQGQCLRKRPF